MCQHGDTNIIAISSSVPCDEGTDFVLPSLVLGEDLGHQTMFVESTNHFFVKNEQPFLCQE